jgi:hypothetical protein
MRSRSIGAACPPGQGVAGNGARHGHFDAARFVVGVGHMVDALGAGRDTFRRGSRGLGLAPHDGAFFIRAAGDRVMRQIRRPARVVNYCRPD